MKLEKDLFDDVIAYIIGEPGAMGANGIIECLNSTGKYFIFVILTKKQVGKRLRSVLMGSMAVNLTDQIGKVSFLQIF